VAYSGDDQRFQYLYRFVSKRRFNPHDRAANRDLLDEGTLSVAQFHEDGNVRWLPLVHNSGPLTSRNGFASQADVLIETRRAATLLGATPMDRPEDVEVNPRTGRVFVLLTNNTEREASDASGANPREANKHGHIIELTPPDQSGKPGHGANEFGWDIFLLAGNPRDPQDGAKYHEQVTADGWLSCPDNCTFDNEGRMWIATDGSPKTTPDRMADGVYACDTSGPGRALTRMFFRAPLGAEVCGPAFTPDDTTFFVAVQHPAEGSTFDAPSTRWPDFDARVPPRPSVLAISREDGRPVGG
jgi:secreted PhoX family phosphatase